MYFQPQVADYLVHLDKKRGVDQKTFLRDKQGLDEGQTLPFAHKKSTPSLQNHTAKPHISSIQCVINVFITKLKCVIRGQPFLGLKTEKKPIREPCCLLHVNQGPMKNERAHFNGRLWGPCSLQQIQNNRF